MIPSRIKWIKLCKTAMLVLLVFTADIFSQNDSQNQPDEKRNGILCEAFAFKSDQPDKGRVEIYVQVPYPEIKFLKENDLYVGRIEISASVLSEGNQLWQKNQMIELSVKDISQTTSPKKTTLKQFSVYLGPGKYDLVVQVTPHESKETQVIRRSLEVRDFIKDTLSLSDIMLAYRLNFKDNGKEIVTNLSGIVEQGSESFGLFFEVYNSVKLDSIVMNCQIVNSKNDVVLRYWKTEIPAGNKTQIAWQIDTPSVEADKCIIRIDASGYSGALKEQKLNARVSRNCTVRIKNIPSTITDIDKAIAELLYIAEGSEIDDIQNAPNHDEKQKRFLAFWAKRDPDPKTAENELMEEYYSRVDYANKNFSNFREGWKSDMGMVFIKYGMAESIERRPINAENKPYEIWYYYNLNRQFIFIDETGFGDYRLRYPLTDLWGRIR